MYAKYLIISIHTSTLLSNLSYSPWQPPTNSSPTFMVSSFVLYAMSSIGAAHRYITVAPFTGS